MYTSEAWNEIGLLRLLDTDVRVYEGARHAAYMDQPERFRKDVLDFYGTITRPDKPAA